MRRFRPRQFGSTTHRCNPSTRRDGPVRRTARVNLAGPNSDCFLPGHSSCPPRARGAQATLLSPPSTSTAQEYILLILTGVTLSTMSRQGDESKTLITHIS
ncbi:hypothetical protein B0H19DRAFT_1244310, partial [Mycena capillaripes]